MSQNNSDREHALWKKHLAKMCEGGLQLGPYYSAHFLKDPLHMAFTLSRYKFAARMIGFQERKKSVLELGCHEGIGTLLLAQEASSAVGVDFDREAIDWASAHLQKPDLRFIADDFLGKSYGAFDAVVSLDVIEHIDSKREDAFLETVRRNLAEDGFAVVGTPNVAASQYSSEQSRIGHINLYDHVRLRALFLKGFHNVFLFGMNDEVVHTGFPPMCHYLMILACHKR